MPKNKETLDPVELGFEDMTTWEEENPGSINYVCEYCGIYTASKPHCNKCEIFD